MAKLKDLQNYLDYEFSSGPYTGEDYKQFQTKYINYLRGLCKENGWTLENIGRGHYNFSLFIKNTDGNFIYLSISDVRGFSNEWYNHILYRTAASDKDYHGGINHYATLTELPQVLSSMFYRMSL